ncbi:MAG: VCBS repeat-containing protein [Planctomycetes bacterium]|nr:VCBS repeat-containing protein [Planctomycetota bacterium]
MMNAFRLGGLTLLCFSPVAASVCAQGGPPVYAPPVVFAGPPGPPVPAPAPGTPPQLLAVGDFNGDALPDVVHLNTAMAPDMIVPHLRFGAGFIIGPPTVLGGYPVLDSIAVGDLNTDGILDAVVMSPAAALIFAQPGTGAGGFAFGPATPVPAGGGTLVSMEITEVSGDGIPDILILVNAPGGAPGIDWMQPMIGFPGFAYVPAPILPLGSGALSMKPADLDADGDQDLVVLRNFPANGYYIYGQIAPVTFVPGPMPIVPLPAGAGMFTFQVGDVDGDADLDLVTINPPTATIFCNLEVAPGMFGASIPSPTVAPLAQNFLLGDFNGDCNLDLHLLSPGAGVTGVQLGLGVGGVFAGAVFGFPMPGVSFWDAAADFNVDGTLDLVLLNTVPGDAITYYVDAQPVPAGVANYGVATPGCRGEHGMYTNGPPVVGTPGFGFTSSNAPGNALGLLLICDVPSPVGIDPFGIGASLLLDLLASTTIYAFDIRSGPTGSSRAITGIPADPTLIGSTFYAQTLWLWTAQDACFPSPLGVTTSEGLALTILP